LNVSTADIFVSGPPPPTGTQAGSFIKSEEFCLLLLLRFTSDNHLDEGVWHWTDVDAIVSYAGGERAGVQPVFVEQILGEFKATFPDRPSSRAFWQRGMQVKLVLDSSKKSLLAMRRPLT
jgi:hypothetical protein